MRYVGVLGLIFATVFGISWAVRTEAGPAPQQDVIRLESRLSQLEQRLFSIETNVRSLEQQARLAGANPRSTVSQEDLAVLRSAIQSLQLRLADDECGLAKLDERTLSPAARRKSGAGSDPCRANFDIPLHLPERRE